MRLRPSTLTERKKFYKNEFSINKVKSFLKKTPQFFVLDLGSETNIIKNNGKIKKLVILKPNITYKELRKKLIELVPEDVYYDRNRYIDINKVIKNMDFKNAIISENCLGQELVFDIDPENIRCPNHSKDFLKFCPACIKMSLNCGLELKKVLQKYFEKIKIVYSGRGCHVHIMDKEAFRFTLKQRNNLNKNLRKFPIDPWVSHGHIRLIRLPYSLNSLVSRIVTPLKDKEIKNFNPETEVKIIPKFMKS